MFEVASGKSTGVITHFWYSSVLPNPLQYHQRSNHDQDNAVNQGQATQPGTPSYCLTLTHTTYQTAHSIELAAPTQDIVCMGGGSEDEMPSEASHLH
jgi:hypothetical protein